MKDKWLKWCVVCLTRKHPDFQCCKLESLEWFWQKFYEITLSWFPIHLAKFCPNQSHLQTDICKKVKKIITIYVTEAYRILIDNDSDGSNDYSAMLTTTMMVAMILVSANILFSWLHGPIRKNVLHTHSTFTIVCGMWTLVSSEQVWCLFTESSKQTEPR